MLCISSKPYQFIRNHSLRLLYTFWHVSCLFSRVMRLYKGISHLLIDLIHCLKTLNHNSWKEGKIFQKIYRISDKLFQIIWWNMNNISQVTVEDSAQQVYKLQQTFFLYGIKSQNFGMTKWKLSKTLLQIKMNSNFNCNYMAMSSLTYILGFSVRFFQPVYSV
jgi:hypothetical protein